MPNVVDNTQVDEEMSRLFADKYSNLYKCVSYDTNNLYIVREELERDVETSCHKGNCSSIHNITVDDVTKE